MAIALQSKVVTKRLRVLHAQPYHNYLRKCENNWIFLIQKEVAILLLLLGD